MCFGDGWLKQLNRIARWIVKVNLFSTDTGNNIIPEVTENDSHGFSIRRDGGDGLLGKQGDGGSETQDLGDNIQSKG